jgi:hypothetical protein
VPIGAAIVYVELILGELVPRRSRSASKAIALAVSWPLLLMAGPRGG